MVRLGEQVQVRERSCERSGMREARRSEPACILSRHAGGRAAFHTRGPPGVSETVAVQAGAENASCTQRVKLHNTQSFAFGAGIGPRGVRRPSPGKVGTQTFTAQGLAR